MFFWWLIFQMKKLLTFGIFNDSNIWVNLKKWGIGVNYCWSYGPSKLLLHFIEYRLDQLNSKHTKIAVNSAIQYFEGCCKKKCLLKVRHFLVHPPQNVGPVKICEIERKPSFNGQYFQTSRISNIWFNENS